MPPMNRQPVNSQQPVKQNGFIVFLKSLLPMVVAIGIQFAVQIPIMIVAGFYLGIKYASAGMDLEDIESLQYAMQDQLYDILADPRFMNILTISTMLVLAIVFIIWFAKSGLGKDMTPIKKALPFRNIILIIGAGYFTQLGISMLLTVLLPLFPKISNQYSEIIDSIAGEINFVTIFSTVILAPIAEELIFRGLTFRGTIRHWNNFMLVNTLQALYFGVYHMNIVQGIYAFVMGLVFGYVAYRLNNVFASMIFHAAVNGSGFLLFVPQTVMDNNLLMIIVAIGAGLIVWALIYLLKIPEVQKAAFAPLQHDNLQGPAGPVYGPGNAPFPGNPYNPGPVNQPPYGQQNNYYPNQQNMYGQNVQNNMYNPNAPINTAPQNVPAEQNNPAIPGTRMFPKPRKIITIT